jgi:hypothetical protein
MKLTIINFESVRDTCASIHATGCSAIERDVHQHGGHVDEGEFASIEEALDYYVDAEMVELGYSHADVHVHDCAAKAEIAEEAYEMRPTSATLIPAS